jgi:predicted transposase/invertase (TIGR01784 family)
MEKFLIRFDWAIKRLLKNKANFSILEGFLSELFKHDIKIVSIIDNEGNKSRKDDKFNRVDILVEDINKELIIIEIQNQMEYDYFQRMLYGTSKVITDNIDTGQQYTKVKKVYSINIVYFDLGQGADYVYHGKTDFKGIHKQDLLNLSSKQIELFDKTMPSDLFPEYYVIKVNSFDNVAIDTLDEWIYFLKNTEIPEGFKAKGLLEAREILKIEKLSKTERKDYDSYLEDLRYKASMAWSMKIDAEEKLKKETSIKIAINLLNCNVDLDIVKQTTGLTDDEIDRIKNGR